MEGNTSPDAQKNSNEETRYIINTKNGIVDPETVAEYKEKYLETLRE
jgi:hypothetical protein